MARPEDEPQAAAPSVALERTDPRDLEHRRVRAAVVHRADVPGVVGSASSAIRTGVGRQPVSTAATIRTVEAARTRSPADAGTVTTTAVGSRRARRRRAAPHGRDAHLVQVLVRA